jgi:peptide/nickel transport system permease protein
METRGKAMRSKSIVIGGFLLLIVLAMAAFAGLVFPDDPLDMVGAPLQKPFVSWEEWLGTDSTGRSVAAQLMFGARTSLLIGFIATGVAVLTGVLVGALAGFYGGWVDTLLMRITEAFQIVPSFILLLVLVVVFGSDIQILPNALPPVIVYTSVVMALSILLESALAFLGFSDPDVASWGKLISDGRKVLRTDWTVAFLPGLMILITVLSVSLLGQGINDTLNPRLSRQ